MTDMLGFFSPVYYVTFPAYYVHVDWFPERIDDITNDIK